MRLFILDTPTFLKQMQAQPVRQSHATTMSSYAGGLVERTIDTRCRRVRREAVATSRTRVIR